MLLIWSSRRGQASRSTTALSAGGSGWIAASWTRSSTEVRSRPHKTGAATAIPTIDHTVAGTTDMGIATTAAGGTITGIAGTVVDGAKVSLVTYLISESSPGQMGVVKPPIQPWRL